MLRIASAALLAALLAVAAGGAAAPVASAAGAGGDAQSIWRENRALSAEAALAATPKPYFVLDLERRRIELKTRGFVLFGADIAESAVWGPRLPIGPTAIERRDALQRPEITPGEEKTPETLDEQLLELADMPASYRIFLAGEVEVQIWPVPAEGRKGWGQRSLIWRWRLSRPLVTLRQRRQRHETTSLFLVVQPEDARRIYWSFFEGLDGILIPPR